MKRTFVPPSGPSTSLIAGVGEQPGKTEIFGHPPRPFIGDAGKGLDECLQMTKISRNGLYLTNVIKDLDAPLGHYIYVDEHNHYTIFGEGQQYIAELKDELQSMPNLNCVIAFGNVPLIALCNRIGINKWRGSVLESTLVPGLKVIPTFHPATIVRPKFHYLNKPLICEDLLRVKRESTFHHIQRTPRSIIIVKSFNEAISYLKHTYEVGLKGLTITIDIEVLNHEVDCFSLGWSPTDACCIHFTGPGGDYYNPEEELEIMKHLGYILESERISKVGANFIFDTQFLFRKYGIEPKGPINCTQIAQKISFPDFPAGLDFVTTMYTDIPYYKADGKEWIKMGAGSWEEWWNYNALDSIVPSEAFPRQVQTLNKQHNFETYLEQAKLIKPLTYMGEKGIRINVQGMIEFQKTESAKLDELATELRSEVGYDINYNSPPQLMNYFYKEQGLEPYKKKNDSGKYVDTIDVDALKRIFRRKLGKVSHVAEIMLDIRSLTKRISTYLNVNKIDPDGRMRSSYKPAGTETGRPASGKTIFGTGTNQQNWPHDLLQFFLVDEGYMLYSIDLSQIENRIVAYTGNVIPQIEAFEQGRDLHRLTASILFHKKYEEISDEDGSSVLGDGRQSERYWGKKCKLKDCQVLSEQGWIYIDKAYKTNCKIAQWSTDGTITFEQPISWFTESYSGDIHTIENQRIYQEATPEHKMPLYYEDGRIINKPIKEYPKSGKYAAPLSGIYNGLVSISPYIMKLIAAFQADGSWNNSGGIVIRLQKERKIIRLKAILELANIEYNDNPSGIYISATDPVSKLIMLLLGKDKLFGPWLLELNQESLLSLIDELHYWDGYSDDIRHQYFTTNLNNAKWIQTITHLCGKATIINTQHNDKTNSFGNKNVYILNIRNTTSPATHAINHSIKQVDNVQIYCPTMPSGYFLCNEHGLISITGNSNHATNYDVQYKTFALKNEMPETEAKEILETIHRGYPQIRGGYHVMVQNMLLNENRTVTNLYGRTRLFLGPIVESYPNVTKYAVADTFREAYAHFAQSTCADKIIRQGVNYIYYNQDLFKDLEILTEIHDSIVFQIPLSIPFLYHAEVILLIKQSLEQSLEWKGRTIPILADLAIGYNMYKKQQKEFKSKNIPNDKYKLAELIEGVYQTMKPKMDELYYGGGNGL